MASQQPPDLTIESLAGGMNDDDNASSLPADQCVLAMNVEFWESALGERRKGCKAINIAGSGLDGEDAVVHIVPHSTVDLSTQIGPEIPQELWAIASTIGASSTIARRVDGSWEEITPVDAIDPDYNLKLNSASYHGKLFIAYKSDEDRLHVWDGTELRRAGMAAPVDAPVVVDGGGAGTFAGARTYRVRFGTLDGLTITRMSEPSPEVTFTPSGAHAGAVITIPATVAEEGATAWSVEADDGTGNFYIIAAQAVGTTTYTDSVAAVEDYATVGLLLAPSIGDYSLIPSVKFIKVDQDRLIFAGNFDDEEAGSRLYWTPVFADPGYMNDERIPLASTIAATNFRDLDWQAGGGITGLSDPIDGSFYVFKLSRIYKVQRTNVLEMAYEDHLMTTQRGALYGSVVTGIDEFGHGCIYFIDPAVGPCRISSAGLQVVRGLRGTWKSINSGADHIISHGVYYPDKEQVHWWLAYQHAETPNIKFVLQTNEVQSQENGTTRGWSLANGSIAAAWCSAIVPEIVLDPDGTRHLAHTPYIGRLGGIRRCDTGDDDAGTAYQARIVTRPYLAAGLLNHWGSMEAALLAEALDDDTIEMDISLIRDFGKETNTVTTNFIPDGDETAVIKVFDNLLMSESKAIQIEFKDAS